MPLTKIGKEILKKFQKTYGKKQGTRLFYAWENKYQDIRNAYLLQKKKKK